MLIAAAIMAWTCANAQSNPYKIDDRLYRIYTEATKYRTLKRGLQLADSMLNMANSMGDKKAQCLALSVRMFHFYYNSNNGDTEFYKAVKAMEDRALATGYRQYYYFGLTNRANFLAEHGKIYEAINAVRAFENKARKDKDMQGVFYGLNSLAQLHMKRSEVGMAINTLKEALQIGLKYVKDQDMGTIYRKLSECYAEIYDYPDMYDAAHKGYAIAKVKYTQLHLLRNMAFAKINMHDDEAVKSLYQTFKNANGGKIDTKGTDIINREMVVMYLIAYNCTDEAQQWLDKAFDKYAPQHTRLQMICNKRAGAYESLAEMCTQFYRKNIVLRDSMNMHDMSGLKATIFNQWLALDNQRLANEHQRIANMQQHDEIETARLKLYNTRLTLRNSSLELGKAKADATQMRLANSNKKLEAERLRKLIETQKAHKQMQDALLITAIAIVAVVLGAVAIYMRSHNRLMRRLRQINVKLENKNRQLTEAKELAEAANRAKTAFISSMGEEIRSPLYSIVSNARTIANYPHSNVPQNDCKKYQNSLQTNTNSLLDIVANVLKKAQTT